MKPSSPNYNSESRVAFDNLFERLRAINLKQLALDDEEVKYLTIYEYQLFGQIFIEPYQA